jgi:putative Mg2+ transporter-C (MgtC) family protein
MEFLSTDWSLSGSSLLSLLIAFLLALPIAWDREQEARTAGLRTFPLVALATCGLMQVGQSLFPQHPDSQARLMQGLMTGVGFIGGGAILKHGVTVEGTATAASIWATGVVGISVAYGRFEIGAVLALFNFATLRLLTPLKKGEDREADKEE